MLIHTGTYFVYRHIRKDTNEVFYVGRGKTYIRTRSKKINCIDSYVGKYWRAFQKSPRHKFWQSIVAKTDYDIEIIFESEDINIIMEKEKEFIKLYGRRDLWTGTLVNMTDGGDGLINLSQSSKDMIRDTQLKRGWHEKMKIDRLINIFIYDINGFFIKKCIDKYECADFLKCSHTTINNYLNRKVSLNGFLLSKNGNGIKASDYIIPRNKLAKVEKYDINGNLLNVFESIASAILKDNTYSSAIKRSLETRKPVKGVLWKRA